MSSDVAHVPNDLTCDPLPTNPIALFQKWLKDAQAAEINDPEAMCLATVDTDGQPSARMVLLKNCDENGFVFYTNFESRKGQDLANTPKASLCFHWKSLRRQVRIEGAVETVSDTEADAYYNSRPLSSRLGAWASQQSRPLDSPETLRAKMAEVTKTFQEVPPRPPHWGGKRVVPHRIEFWHDQRSRLHDRLIYLCQKNKSWTTFRLNP